MINAGYSACLMRPRHRTSHISACTPCSTAAKKPPATPCTPLYYALAKQLEDISSGATLPEDQRQLSGAAAWYLVASSPWS